MNWHQPQLCRDGLWEDVSTRRLGNIIWRYNMMPSIEEAYRNIRVALESNKNFDSASDFYIGEREMNRLHMHPLRAHLLSIDAWYNALSQYGTNPGRALRFLMWLVLFHLFTTALLMDSSSPLFIVSQSNLTHTLQVVTLQKIIGTEFNTDSVILLDVIFRAIAPIILALTALSFRSRIKRH